jgi:RNA polymerase sigma-70 factor (ECF subfamily)
MKDEELVSEFSSSHDLEILGELYLKYMHLVYGVCLKYLKNREEAMDAVMQIFEKLISDIPKQRIENFRSWLHVVTKNYCLMQLRSMKGEDEKLREWMLTTGIVENEHYVHPLDNEQQEIDNLLADCIERLNGEQKECIKRFYYESRCYKEIAEDLGIDEKKVKSNLQNGKRNLKICIEEKDERDE